MKQRKNQQKVVLLRSPSESHCARQHGYKQNNSTLTVDMSKFVDVINVEKIGMNIDIIHYLKKWFNHFGDISNSKLQPVAVVEVESMCSMEKLVDHLFEFHGLIPAIVPEFKGITVGGSIQGLAAESTSFKFGFFHNAVIGFEIVLLNGDVKWCSPSSNADLFYSVPGSFGSLGICTKAKLLCVSSSPFVKVTSKKYDSNQDCVSNFKEHFNDLNVRNNIDFIEGIAYSKNNYVAISGEMISQSEFIKSNLRLEKCNAFGYDWFYNTVKKSIGKPFCLPIRDYLFRHDRGSFWMASYRIPQFIGKYMGKLLDNSNMFKLANLLPFAFPKNIIVLQDFMLPINSVSNFIEDIQPSLDVYPIWLLPMKSVYSNTKDKTIKKYSVFTENISINSRDICNVGVYGIPNNQKYDYIPYNKLFESILHKHRGNKVYYSHSFYERDFFYNNICNGKEYWSLRKKYCSDDGFPDVFTKVVTSDGKL
eukprot:gene6994-9558_t